MEALRLGTSGGDSGRAVRSREGAAKQALTRSDPLFEPVRYCGNGARAHFAAGAASPRWGAIAQRARSRAQGVTTHRGKFAAFVSTSVTDWVGASQVQFWAGMPPRVTDCGALG